MPNYIVFHSESSTLKLAPEKPEEYISIVFSLFGRLLPVWMHPDVEDHFKTTLVTSIKARHEILIRDVDFVASRLLSLYDGCKVLFIALGASPKMVKWMLKAKGAQVITVNASAIKVTSHRTEQFDEYLRSKLQRHQDKTHLVIMDFADSAQSLYRIKYDIKTVTGYKFIVESVAIGHSDQLEKHCNRNYKASLAHIFKKEIPTLDNELFTQNTKRTLGRNKVKNPYENWSWRNRLIDKTHKEYRAHKSAHKSLFLLPMLNMTTDQLLELQMDYLNSLPPATDDGDDDFSEYSYGSVDLGEFMPYESDHEGHETGSH